MRGFLLVVFLLLSPLVGRAETIMVNSSQGGIYLVDVETLAVEEITRAPQFFDIAVSPKGEIYGVTSGGHIWKVVPGGVHLPLGVVRVFVNALEFRSDGALLGAGSQTVVVIAPTTGAVLSVGSFPGFQSSGDMAFAPDGVLYATGSPGPRSMDTLFRMVPGGTMTPVGPIGFQNVYGLVWSHKFGTLIGVTEARELITVDPKTGVGRLLGILDIPGRGYGAAGFAPALAPLGFLMPGSATF